MCGNIIKKTYKDRVQYEFDYKQNFVHDERRDKLLYAWCIMTFVYSIYSI